MRMSPARAERGIEIFAGERAVSSTWPCIDEVVRPGSVTARKARSGGAEWSLLVDTSRVDGTLQGEDDGRPRGATRATEAI